MAPPLDAQPTGDGYDLMHCEAYALNTLVSGTKVFVIFPPTPSNLDTLREKWEALAKVDDFYSTPFWERMEGGIALIQRAGETLIVPPFCPYISCSLETSVSAEYWIVTAKKIHLRMENTRLTLAQNNCEPAAVRDVKLIQRCDSIQTALHMILDEAVENFDSIRTIIKMCQIWPQVKDEIRAMCEAIEDQKTRVTIIDKFRRMWTQFLEKKKKKSGKCRLCSLPVKSMTMTLAEHFVTDHWQAARVAQDQDPEKAGDQMEID